MSWEAQNAKEVVSIVWDVRGDVSPEKETWWVKGGEGRRILGMRTAGEQVRCSIECLGNWRRLLCLEYSVGRTERHEMRHDGYSRADVASAKIQAYHFTFSLWMFFMERWVPAFPCLYHQFKRHWNGCFRNHLEHVRWKIPNVPSFCWAGHEQMSTWVSCPTLQER